MPAIKIFTDINFTRPLLIKNEKRSDNKTNKTHLISSMSIEICKSNHYTICASNLARFNFFENKRLDHIKSKIKVNKKKQLLAKHNIVASFLPIKQTWTPPCRIQFSSSSKIKIYNVLKSELITFTRRRQGECHRMCFKVAV